MPRGLLCLSRVDLEGFFISSLTHSYWFDFRGGVWRCRVREGSAKWPKRDAHSGGEEKWAFMPTRKPQRDETYLQQRGSQTRPCSTAKRVAAARELAPIL